MKGCRDNGCAGSRKVVSRVCLLMEKELRDWRRGCDRWASIQKKYDVLQLQIKESILQFVSNEKDFH